MPQQLLQETQWHLELLLASIKMLYGVLMSKQSESTYMFSTLNMISQVYYTLQGAWIKSCLFNFWPTEIHLTAPMKNQSKAYMSGTKFSKSQKLSSWYRKGWIHKWMLQLQKIYTSKNT